MSDALSGLRLDIDDTGAACVTRGDARFGAAAELLAAVPELRAPEQAGLCADLLNHLLRGFDYEVIHDPDAFGAAYRARLAAEVGLPDAGPGEVRLANYAAPPLSEIAVPRRDGDRVLFFARSAYLGVPYRVAISDAGEAEYDPLMS